MLRQAIRPTHREDIVTNISWQAIHADKPIVDLHIHPAMNRLVLKQNLGLRYVVSRSFNPLAVRASWPRLHDGATASFIPSSTCQNAA